jgi:hypothetical protein
MLFACGDAVFAASGDFFADAACTKSSNAANAGASTCCAIHVPAADALIKYTTAATTSKYDDGLRRTPASRPMRCAACVFLRRKFILPPLVPV